MHTRRRAPSALCAIALAVGAVVGAAPRATSAQAAPAQAPPAQAPPVPRPPATARAPVTPLYRVILNDGTALVSYGEYARVGDRVVFSMPVGSPRGDTFQLVTLPASVVNWESTGQYTASVRYTQYMTTRGEADFALLTGQVAQALSLIGATKDPARRLQIAEQTRRVIADWPLEHYGYRSNDVNDMLSLLDGTISQLRETTGVKRFDFSLVATIEPPSMPLLPDPSASQSIDQLLLAARLSEVPAERMALLRSAIVAIDAARGTLSAPWAEATRALAEAQLAREARTERGYAALSRAAVVRAQAAAKRADVFGVQRAIASFQAGDRALGRQRKDEVDGVLALLQQRLDAARRLRLMRDQWVQKSAAIRVYRRAVSLPIAQLVALGPRLADVKALAGPDVALLPTLARRFDAIAARLSRVKVPPDLVSAHASLQSAAELGGQAMRVRQEAVSEGSMDTAWDASSAAAASIQMLALARRQIAEAARPPELR